MAASWFPCFSWWHSPERAPLLNVRPTNPFPPPHTVLTAPAARLRPLAHLASLLGLPPDAGPAALPNEAHRSYDSRHAHHSGASSGGASEGSDASAASRPLSIIEYSERRREERLEHHRKECERREAERKRQRNISATYGSLMCKVDRQSLPPTPTFVNETYRLRRESSSDHLHVHPFTPITPLDTPAEDPVAATVAADADHPCPSDPRSGQYGAIGLGICGPPLEALVEMIPSTHVPRLLSGGGTARRLAAAPPTFSNSRAPPGLVVTAPSSYPHHTAHPSTIAPLRQREESGACEKSDGADTVTTTSTDFPITPPAPVAAGVPRAPERGRTMSPTRNAACARTNYISSRDSSLSVGTRSTATGPSRRASFSHVDLFSDDGSESGDGTARRYDVVYKEIGLAGLGHGHGHPHGHAYASHAHGTAHGHGASAMPSPRRRRFKHRRRSRISWMDEKEHPARVLVQRRDS